MNEGASSKTVAALLSEAASVLDSAGVDEPRRQAASLLAFAADRDRAFLITHRDEIVGREVADRFRAMVARRARREPLQYITGRQEFYNLEFLVTPAVLIPRPETELLVERAIDLLRDAAAPLVFDVGTGSGCIAVSLLHELPRARAVAIDISPAALLVARANAARHAVSERLSLVAGDGLRALAAGGVAAATLIVSNPPYIDEAVVAGLQPEVGQYEPRQALTPGADGLSMIGDLLREAPSRLTAGGRLLCELGFDQSARLTAMVDPRRWTLRAIHPDLQGVPRVAELELKPASGRRGPAAC